MNRTTITKNAKRLALGLAALALAAAPSFAQTTVDLCATTGTVTMPDGAVVPIWGYVLGSTCTADTATLPNPVIRATAGEALTINLTNNLTETVSFFVPGLLGTANGGGPGFFTTEAAALGGTVSYTFTPDAGTYLYQSATSRIRTQVPMGLYGALVVDAGPGEAYPGVTYDQDQVLVYSAIDPNINANPATYGGARVSNNTLSVADEGFVFGWLPQYFLINGKAFPSTETIAVNSGVDVLLRFVNAGLDTVVPTLGGGLYMDVVAEDGNLLPVAFSQYGLELQPGKTFDALINVAAEGRYPLYDRALNLTNGMATGGGMLVYLDSAPTPTAVDDPYAGVEDTLLSVAARGVLSNDLAANGTSPIPASYTASLVSDVSNGLLALAADGSFTYTPDPNFFGVDSFTYRAVDTAAGPDSNVATVTITVALGDNDPPVADPQSVTTSINTAVVITLTGSDPEGSLLTFAPGTVPASGLLSDFNAVAGTVTYTPNVGFVGADSFTFTVDDGASLSAPATVTITVVASIHFSTEGIAVAVPGVGGIADNADVYKWDGTAFSRVVDAAGVGSVGLSGAANVDGLVLVDSTHFYMSFTAETTAVPGIGNVQDEDIVYYNGTSWLVFFDGTANGLTDANEDIDAFDIEGGIIYFSTVGNTNPPGVAGTADNADIYAWNGSAFSRVVDVTALGQPLPGVANVDGLVYIDPTHFYLSFAAVNTAMPAASGLGNVQDEDVVYYNNGTWSVYFDGTALGLTDASQDLDAIQIP